MDWSGHFLVKIPLDGFADFIRSQECRRRSGATGREIDEAMDGVRIAQDSPSMVRAERCGEM